MKQIGAFMPGLRRNFGMDALRTLAVLSMMAAHTSRLIEFESRREWSRWVLLLEPLIPSLFLFLVGISLTYSIAKAENPGTWFFRQTRRAAILWLISAIFFSVEYGIRLPDVVMDSGILCTIAYSILSIGAALLLPRPVWVLSLLLGVGSLGFMLLDRADANPFLFISGNSPLFPLWLLALCGALWGLMMRRIPTVVLFIEGAAFIFAVWAIWRHGWEALFTYPLGRSDATRLLAPPITGGAAMTVGYYNLRPLLYFFCLSVHLCALRLMTIVLSPLKELWARRYFALGRHSLEAYVLHLFLLALLVVSFGPRPLKASWEGDIVLFGVAILCFGWTFLREKFRFFRTK